VTTLHVLRVFADESGRHGNPLGVFMAGAEVPPRERQGVARDLGFSETVFVDDASSGALQIFTPAVELPFAGHPLVGAAWLLASLGSLPEALRPPAGEVPIRVEGDRAYVAGRPEWAPAFEWHELGSSDDVDSLSGPPAGEDVAAFYAHAGKGEVRARVFPVRYGIDEDEATGAAALLLAARLGRAVSVRQGRGSIIEVRPLEGGMVELGGRVVLDEVRETP
jgi:predicted PhzF superfamily epimerase YddE/YHI9